MKKNALKKLLFSHDNDYGFDPLECITVEKYTNIPNLSIIIPYFNTGEIFDTVINHLYNSIKLITSNYPQWKYEIIIIDDGSKEKPLSKIKLKEDPHIKYLKNELNMGRSFTRQRGLEDSKYDLCLFMDSDILIDRSVILHHLKIHKHGINLKDKPYITVSFFEFTEDNNHHLLKYSQITPNDLKLNDYRLHCTYGSTWIGCEKDKEFIGMEFNIVHDTNFFRNWKGMFHAWALSNMVLGGFFVVNRKDSLAVGGFNQSFNDYGFTETSLVTKLIAINGNFVIPMVIGGGLHLEDKKINVTRKKKDKIFWKKHEFYFNKYLYLTAKEAINDTLT